MGLFLAGLALAVAGVLLSIQPGGTTLASGVVIIIGGAVMMFNSQADQYASGILLLIIVGFGYFLRQRPAMAIDEEAEPDDAEDDFTPADAD